MSLPSAWSIKGVDEEAKSLAKRSAAECGVTMGAWLEAAILHISKKTGSPEPLTDSAAAWPQSVDTRPVAAADISSGKKIFNTTIRMGQLVPDNAAANSAILEEVQKIHQQMRDGFDDVESRLALIETNLEEVTKSLPAPTVGESLASPAARDYALETISASYQPMAVSALLPPPSVQTPPSIAMVNSVLRWMIVATMGVIAFLIGQHLGVTLF